MNFSAVNAPEKLTTFTSTSPARLPAAMVSPSVISRFPFGRTTHSAPPGFMFLASAVSRSRAARLSAG
jgi:hypothetical protein